ncbi:hypothetical protein HOA92_05365 [archaeon]|nr:hypothetical protein [archaeon]MBT6762443.1 hypothetical protein [archaeon]
MKPQTQLKILGITVTLVVVVTFLLFIFTVITPAVLWAVLLPSFIIAYWVVPKLKERINE